MKTKSNVMKRQQGVMERNTWRMGVGGVKSEGQGSHN